MWVRWREVRRLAGFTQLHSRWRRWSIMDLTLDLFPTAGRHPVRLTDRWTVVVLVPADGIVVLGFFFNGELLHLVDEPGERHEAVDLVAGRADRAFVSEGPSLHDPMTMYRRCCTNNQAIIRRG